MSVMVTKKRCGRFLRCSLTAILDNIFVKEKLADLYFRSNRYDAYLAQLEGLIDKKPDAKYAQKLLAQVELGGRAEEEKRLLERFATMPFFSAAHAGRLGLIELNLGPSRQGFEHAAAHGRVES